MRMVYEEKKNPTNVEEVNRANFGIFKKLFGIEEICMV